MILLNKLSPLVSITLWGFNLIAILDMYKRHDYNFLWINYVLLIIGIVSNAPCIALLIIFYKKYNNYVKHFQIMSQFIEF